MRARVFGLFAVVILALILAVSSAGAESTVAITDDTFPQFIDFIGRTCSPVDGVKSADLTIELSIILQDLRLVYDRTVEQDGVTVAAVVLENPESYIIIACLDIVAPSGVLSVRIGSLAGESKVLSSGGGLEMTEKAALLALIPLLTEELQRQDSDGIEVLRDLVNFAGSAPAGFNFPTESPSFSIGKIRDNAALYGVAPNTVASLDNDGLTCVSPPAGIHLGPAYSVSFDNSEGSYSDLVRTTGPESPWLPGYCLGQCGVDCDSWTLGKWGLDCLEHDVCVSPSGSRGNDCDDEYLHAIDDFLGGCTAPFPIHTLEASQGTDTSGIELLWTPVAFTDSYKLFRALYGKDSNPCDSGTAIATDIPGDSWSFTDTTVIPNKRYLYAIKSKKDTSYSKCSNYAEGHRRLSAPTNLQASDGPSRDYVRVSWSRPAGEGISSFKLYRAIMDQYPCDGRVIGSKIFTISGQSDSYVDWDATAGVPYYYSIEASGLSVSECSNVDRGYRVKITDELSPPGNVRASQGKFTDRVRITWTAPSPRAGYRLYRSTAASIACERMLRELPASAASYDDFSVTPGVSYYYSLGTTLDTEESPCSQVVRGNSRGR